MGNIAKTAKFLREKKGLSQREAAVALGISSVHLSNIENNKAQPSSNLLERYHDLWGVDLHMLAWCLYGDVNLLPLAIRRPMQQLADAWKQELGEFVEG